MRGHATADIEVELNGSTDLIFQVGVHSNLEPVAESMLINAADESAEWEEFSDQAGNRYHRLQAEGGRVSLKYKLEVAEQKGPRVEAEPVDFVTYLRPSRYCESDTLFADTREIFAGKEGFELLAAVRESVNKGLVYDPENTLADGSAVTTIDAGRGVCRDFTHVCIAMLRAMDVPARYVAAYAPGLEPMDFHAVAEAYIDGAWWVIDATGLAPRRHLIRIATGRDAADCAFLTSHGENLTVTALAVDAFLTDEDGNPLEAGIDNPDELIRIT